MATIEEDLDITASVPSAGVPSAGGMQRRVWGLAWPVIAENFLETLLGVVDTWLVSHLALGAIAVAGVGVAQQMQWFLISALSALSVGTTVLVAQAFGGDRRARAGLLARQSLAWSVVISVPLAIGGLLLSTPVIRLFSTEPEVVRIGVSYMDVTMGTVIVLVALFISSGALRGIGDTRSPMIATLIANVINIVLAWALIYGQLGLPALGAVGSAWATFISRAIALAIVLVILWRGRNGVTIRGREGWRPEIKVVRQVLAIGLPAALEQLLMASAFTALTLIIAQLGTNALAAQRIAINAISLSFLPGFGFGIAATTLVGQSVGARKVREGSHAARIATIYAMIWMTLIGLMLLVFAPQAMALFTQDQAVIDAGTGALRVVALQQAIWAIGLVQAGALRGTGNTRIPLIVSGSAMWITVALAAIWLARFGGGLTVAWAMFFVTAPVESFLLFYFFRRSANALAAKQAREDALSTR
jgi:putative MATE family efflux protein